MSFADQIEPTFANVVVQADEEARPTGLIDLSAVRDMGRTNSGVVKRIGWSCAPWVRIGMRVIFDSRAGRIIAPEGVVGREPLVQMHQDAITGIVQS